MANPFIGDIRMFAGNFAPRNYATCDGQVLPITQNQALFSILGTTYGGDGRTTFALPDLRGRLPLHFGTGAGQPSYVRGQQGGTETVTLDVSTVPPHTHSLFGTTAAATQASPANGTLAVPARRVYTTDGTVQALAPSVGQTGNNQPHSNFQPYLVVNFIIALQGVFPTQ